MQRLYSPRNRSSRRLAIEPLERRLTLSAVPFGAMAQDTGEFMLGDVLVTVVLMESSEKISSTNDNSETWTNESIEEVKRKIEEGLNWWPETLAEITDKHRLSFQIDYTYADNLVPTEYEPITRLSFDFQFWIYDFLDEVGFNHTGDFSTDIRTFNHAQRQAHGTDWAFTIFVVNDAHDDDGMFLPGGFSRAFAFSGGRFFITPAGRPASTIAHETGHMFWARDEYFGGGTYDSFRGYYNTQNLNAADNPNAGHQQVPSIMATGDCDSGGGLLCTAYQSHTSSPSSLEMVGWRDSDGDGVFDVLDVPHTLEGVGFYDAAESRYRFVGTSRVQALPNLNSSGLQNDVSVAVISRAEFRIDGGPWQTTDFYGQRSADLNLSFPVPEDVSLVEIRTIDDTTGITSPTFVGSVHRPAATTLPGIQGFVWDDADTDGRWDSGEPGLPGWTVELTDPNGQPLELDVHLEPDDFANTDELNEAVPEVFLSTTGQVGVELVASLHSNFASTGDQIFASWSSSCGGFCAEWSESRQLRIDFSQPVTTVSLDAIGSYGGSFARLEIYDDDDNLLARTTTNQLSLGEIETMILGRPVADIAYAIAKGHAATTVILDHLRFGPDTEAVTNGHGAYVFPYLEPGDYQVRVRKSGNTKLTNPTDGVRSVILESGAVVDQIDFGLTVTASTWQNLNPFDVNNDDFVSPVDVLQLINDLNRFGARELEGGTPPPFLDVNGDYSVSSQDVLRVINFINSRTGQDAERASVVDTSSVVANHSTEGESGRALNMASVDAYFAAEASSPHKDSRVEHAGSGTALLEPFERMGLTPHADQRPTLADARLSDQAYSSAVERQPRPIWPGPGTLDAFLLESLAQEQRFSSGSSGHRLPPS